MDYKELTKKLQFETDKVFSFFEKELAKIHTGRASASFLEDIQVDCFGQRFPLKQLAMISVPEARQIVVQPWDTSYFEAIEKAISQSQMGFSPVVDKNVIRVNMPSLTNEYRQSLMKVISKTQEDSKETVRKIRDQVWTDVQKKEREGQIREDDKFKAKNELQKIVDEFNKKTEEVVEKKKKDILE